MGQELSAFLHELWRTYKSDDVWKWIQLYIWDTRDAMISVQGSTNIDPVVEEVNA